MGKEMTVEIRDHEYRPNALDIQIGDQVNFANHDSEEHTATARDGSFDIEIHPNETKSITLEKPDVYEFYCRYHSDMQGVIRVTG